MPCSVFSAQFCSPGPLPITVHVLLDVQEYVSLSFSPDGKLLLAQGGAPDWNLLLWTWEKSKVASSVRSTNLQGSPVVQVRLCWGHLCLQAVLEVTSRQHRTLPSSEQQQVHSACTVIQHQLQCC